MAGHALEQGAEQAERIGDAEDGAAEEHIASAGGGGLRQIGKFQLRDSPEVIEAKLESGELAGCMAEREGQNGDAELAEDLTERAVDRAPEDAQSGPDGEDAQKDFEGVLGGVGGFLPRGEADRCAEGQQEDVE